MIVRDYNHRLVTYNLRELILNQLPTGHEGACTAYELTEDLPEGTDVLSVIRILTGLFNHGYCIRERTYRTGKKLYQYWCQSSDTNQKKAEEENAQIIPMAESIENLEQLTENGQKKNPTYYDSLYHEEVQKRRKELWGRIPTEQEHAAAAFELADAPSGIHLVSRNLSVLYKQGFCHRKYICSDEYRGYLYWRTPQITTLDEIGHAIIYLLGDLGFQVTQDAERVLPKLIDAYKRFYQIDEEEVKKSLPALIVEGMPENNPVITHNWLTALYEELIGTLPPQQKSEEVCSVAGLERLVDNLCEIKEVDVVNPEIPHAELLERLDKVEAETEAIRERYEALEKRLIENELLTALKKAELKKEEEQHKLDALEERMKRWEDENATVAMGVLK